MDLTLFELGTNGLMRTFGEDEPKTAEKERARPSVAEPVIRRPPKAPQINNRLAVLSATEQYHQMCARTTNADTARVPQTHSLRGDKISKSRTATTQ